MTDILESILATKVAEVTGQERKTPLEALKSRSADLPQPRGFVDAIESRIARGAPAVICEIKKASPSKGIIRENLDPVVIGPELCRRWSGLPVRVDRSNLVPGA